MTCHLCGAPTTEGCECSRPRSISIHMELTGAAFTDEEIPDAALTTELARCLRALATEIQKHPADDIDGLPIRDINGNTVGTLAAYTGEPTIKYAFRPTVENIASFLALMQGGGGLMTKAPRYIAEKFDRLADDEPQMLDSGRALMFDDWRNKWSG